MSTMGPRHLSVSGFGEEPKDSLSPLLHLPSRSHPSLSPCSSPRTPGVVGEQRRSPP
jgi:hypothetical protein